MHRILNVRMLLVLHHPAPEFELHQRNAAQDNREITRHTKKPPVGEGQAGRSLLQFSRAEVCSVG